MAAPDGIVTDPKVSAVLDASHDARDQALSLVDIIAATGPLDNASAETQAEVSKQQKLLITNFAKLRGLHRNAHLGSRHTKQETAGARLEVDRLHLQLQNLYYEQRHLQGEITACESYESVDTAISTLLGQIACAASSDDASMFIPDKPVYSLSASRLAQELTSLLSSHTYQQLPLIPVEEFLALKPEHASDDENDLMIARIEHERTERESLEQQRMELLKRKQKLISDNKKRKDDLANLDKELEKFIDVRPFARADSAGVLTNCRLPNLSKSCSRRTYLDSTFCKSYPWAMTPWELQIQCIHDLTPRQPASSARGVSTPLSPILYPALGS